ncbi:MAG: metalloregulator ArsR/SmtB family transcription factor [Alphaproteobacteria bacterium]|nr:metalloregulator ArsR/SmtB family transcription factor [Alphaproteobacteria bacterium]
MKSLANAYRLMILCRLHEGECSVGALEKWLGLNQSALSQHLARLRRDGIVATRRESQTIYYRLVDAQASRIVVQLYSLYCHPTASPLPKRRKTS